MRANFARTLSRSGSTPSTLVNSAIFASWLARQADQLEAVYIGCRKGKGDLMPSLILSITYLHPPHEIAR